MDPKNQGGGVVVLSPEPPFHQIIKLKQLSQNYKFLPHVMYTITFPKSLQFVKIKKSNQFSNPMTSTPNLAFPNCHLQLHHLLVITVITMESICAQIADDSLSSTLPHFYNSMLCCNIQHRYSILKNGLSRSPVALGSYAAGVILLEIWRFFTS